MRTQTCGVEFPGDLLHSEIGGALLRRGRCIKKHEKNCRVFFVHGCYPERVKLIQASANLETVRQESGATVTADCSYPRREGPQPRHRSAPPPTCYPPPLRQNFHQVGVFIMGINCRRIRWTRNINPSAQERVMMGVTVTWCGKIYRQRIRQEAMVADTGSCMSPAAAGSPFAAFAILHATNRSPRWINPSMTHPTC